MRGVYQEFEHKSNSMDQTIGCSRQKGRDRIAYD